MFSFSSFAPWLSYYSFANRHQFWITSKEIEFRKRNTSAYQGDICQVSKQTVENIHRDSLKPWKYINCVKYWKLNGFIYYTGAFLIIDLALKASSSVGLKETILTVDGKIVFYLEIYRIVSKIRKYNCNQVTITKTYIHIKYEDLDYEQIN